MGQRKQESNTLKFCVTFLFRGFPEVLKRAQVFTAVPGEPCGQHPVPAPHTVLRRQLDRGGFLMGEIRLVIPTVFLQGSLEVIILLTANQLGMEDLTLPSSSEKLLILYH